MPSHFFLTSLIVATLAAATVITPSNAEEADSFFWDESNEIAIARSAAPEQVSLNATIWVLKQDGFVIAVEGSNDFNCLVMRKWSALFDVQEELFDWDALVAPICFDPQSSKGPMAEQFMRHKLGLSGATHDEIKAAVYFAYADGDIPLPVSGSFSYMFSSAQNLSPNAGHWHPHVMVYTQNYKNEMLGGFTPASGNPIVFEAPGTFRAVVAIPVDGRNSHIDP